MRLIKGDCLVEMEKLIKEGVRVDLILTDPPYGMMAGIDDKGTYDWDNIIPIKPMFDNILKILRWKGHAILFSQSEFSARLRLDTDKTNLPFLYGLFWIKNSTGNSLASKTAPVSFVEEINVFSKKYDTSFEHELRPYGAKLLDYIVEQSGEAISRVIKREPGRTGLSHFLTKVGTQFSIPSEHNYK